MLLHAVPGELGFAEIAVILRVGADDMGGEARHVARGDPLPRAAFAPGVGEMRAGHAELARPPVHQGRESLLAARDALGQSDRRVVARGDEEAAQEVLDAHLRIGLGKHAGAAGFRVALARRPGRDRRDVVELEPAGASSPKTISAVRIFVVDAGDIGASAFLAKSAAPVS